jgi:RNA polymerase sigma-70 factor, ECF subfamily
MADPDSGVMRETAGSDADDVRLTLAVLRCQAGDERAFTELFHWLGPRTRAYLSALVGDAADDVQQEVWFGVYKSISTLADPRAFRMWLFRSARHRAVDFLRSRKRYDDVFPAMDPEDVELATETPIDLSGLDSDIESLMGMLPAAHREVLLLRYKDELSYSEIAVVVGAPIGTVRTRLHHAKRKLHELLQGNR